jgi:hypothetical protein
MSESHAGCNGYRFMITEIPELRHGCVTPEMHFLGFYGYYVSAKQWMNIMGLVI